MAQLLESDPSAEQERVRSLRRMKAVPLALLLFAAAVYLVARRMESLPEASAAWGYIRAMAEAGVVGGLADWFAVTALFRHPLGVPIPHTAIIPRKKDQLGRSLGTFVRENFLAASTIRQRVEAAEPGLRVGDYLAREENREKLVAEAAAVADHAIDGISDADVQLFVRNTLFTYATTTALAPILGQALDAVVADRNHTGVVDVVLDSTKDWLVSNRGPLVDLIATAGPVSQSGPIRWMHEQVAGKVYESLLAWVIEVRENGDHAARQRLDDALAHLAQSLREDPRTIERVERWKLDQLELPQTQRAVADLWPTMRRLLQEMLRDPRSELRTRANQILAEFGTRLRTDEPYRRSFDVRAADAAEYLANRYGEEAVTVISDTVDRWDGKAAARKIELQVGKDLQFIRINGTVVGALVGLTIHSVSELVVL